MKEKSKLTYFAFSFNPWNSIFPLNLFTHQIATNIIKCLKTKLKLLLSVINFLPKEINKNEELLTVLKLPFFDCL